MDDSEKMMYVAEKERRDHAKAEIEKALEEFDVYSTGMQVLDTDYEKYMMLFHCKEDHYEDEEYEEMK